MKKVASALVLVLTALALAACGGSSGGTTDTEATAGGEAAAGTGGEGQAAGGGSVVKLETVQGSGLEYTTDHATAKAGPVSIEFNNPQAISHDVAIENANGETVGQTELVSEGKAVTTIGDLEPGEYTFYCTVPGHREAGMEGTLTVE
jgi:plastocyanin